MKEQREGAGKRQSVQPDYDCLHFAVCPRAAVFTRHVRIGAKEPLEIGEQISTGGQDDEEEEDENELNEVCLCGLHGGVFHLPKSGFVPIIDFELIFLLRVTYDFWCAAESQCEVS